MHSNVSPIENCIVLFEKQTVQSYWSRKQTPAILCMQTSPEADSLTVQTQWENGNKQEDEEFENANSPTTFEDDLWQDLGFPV